MKKISSISQKGFTLIELMIVVGIVGILVAIAAPNFSRYQSKARQSEAKIALAAIYGAEKSFYSEYAAYAGTMEVIGYQPDGQRRFYAVGFAASHSGNINGFQGSLVGNGGWGIVGASFTCSSAGQGVVTGLPAALQDDAQNFTAGANGCIRNGATSLDGWNITDLKVLSNNQISL